MNKTLDIFCIVGIIICISVGALIYKPPTPPLKQCNYSRVEIVFIAKERPVGFPGIIKGECKDNEKFKAEN